MNQAATSELPRLAEAEGVKPVKPVEVAPEQPTLTGRYWVNWPFQMGGYDYERGEAIRLIGAKNAEKLVRIGYVKPLTVNLRYECGVCGKKFLEERMRDGHGRKFHSKRFESPAIGGPVGLDGLPNVLIDKEGDKEEQRLMATASLNWDKTAASLDA